MESNHSNGKKLVSKSSYLKNPTRMHFYQYRTAAISEHLVNFYVVNHRWKKDNSSNAQTNIHETINMDDGSHIALKLNARNIINRLESISKVVLIHTGRKNKFALNFATRCKVTIAVIASNLQGCKYFGKFRNQMMDENTH